MLNAFLCRISNHCSFWNFTGPKLAFFSCAILCLFPAIAWGGTENPKQLSPEHLEEYDNPPAPLALRGTGVSSGMIAHEGAFTSHQVNVDGSGQNITGDAANECSIAVDPTNHNRMVIG